MTGPEPDAPLGTGHAHQHWPGTPGTDHTGPVADAPADSAGNAWGGRQLPATGFEGDTGHADPALLAALTGGDDVALMRAVERARFLVPVVAVPAEVDTTGEHAVEKETDMASVTLTGPDGTRALPVFTGTEALVVWEPQARPVPVSSQRAAQAAVSEQCDVLVVDPGSDHETELRPSMLWALAQQREWQPAHEDEHVAAAVEAALAPHPQVLGHVLTEGRPAGAGVLQVSLRLVPGLDATQVQALVTAVAEQLATDGEVRARIDGLAFSLA